MELRLMLKTDAQMTLMDPESTNVPIYDQPIPGPETDWLGPCRLRNHFMISMHKVMIINAFAPENNQFF